jgi:hypothetical protein
MRKQILAMKAGRELDALVAEKIFWWTPKINYESGTIEWYGRSPTGALTARPSHWKNGQPPKYSSDLVASWEVVEKMKDKPRLNKFFQLTYEGGAWYCSFGAADSVEGKSAPEVIAKAALLAELTEVDDE